MRVLHVLDHSVPLHSGYSFRTRSILREQQRLGITVDAVTTPRHTASGPDPETIDGLTFHRTPDPGSRLPLWRDWRQVMATRARVAARIAEARPDIVHAHSPMLTALAAGPAARAAGLPLVYEIRAFWEDAAVGNGDGREGDARYRLTRALENHVVARADAVATICAGLGGDLVARGVDPAKLFTVPNAVDLDAFGTPSPRDAALAATLGLEDAEVIGFIGSFYDYEGLDDLIAAMPALVATRPRARLLLVGGGPMEEALKAQAAASPAAGAIMFTGRVPHADVDRYYGLVDILAYPRKAMRLTDLVTPLKPLEAMAQEKLVAASSVGGHRELIRDGDTGTLFPPDDPPAIAAALARLLADRSDWPARRARAKAWVAAERTWSASVANYLPVYDRLAAKGMPA